MADVIDVPAIAVFPRLRDLQRADVILEERAVEFAAGLALEGDARRMLDQKQVDGVENGPAQRRGLRLQLALLLLCRHEGRRRDIEHECEYEDENGTHLERKPYKHKRFPAATAERKCRRGPALSVTCNIMRKRYLSYNCTWVQYSLAL